MKNICIFVLCVILVLGLSSCTYEKEDCPKCDNQFHSGYDKAVKDVFFDNFNASVDFTTLFCGDVWNTEHFTLIMCDKLYGEDWVLNYDITLKNTTIADCLQYENFYFNIYSCYESENDGRDGEMILESDGFIWDGVIDYEGTTEEYEKGNNVKSKCFLYEDVEYQNFLIVITTEGCIYSAVYYP